MGDTDGMDVSVRPALPRDAEAMGRIQVATMRHALEAGLGVPVPPTVASRLDAAAFAAAWAHAIDAPPSPRHRVLTALAGATVVGFAALGPRTDAPGERQLASELPEAEILALEIDPTHGRAGHGSRLLAACVDVLRRQNATRVLTWAVQGDDVRTRFLASAGFAPLGLRRRWSVGQDTVTQIAWHATI